MSLSLQSRRARIALSLSLALLIAATPGAASWKPDPKPVATPEQWLEAMDLRLAPVLAKLDDTFTNIGVATDDLEIEAYVTIIQRTAAQGYTVTSETPWNACYDDYRSMMLTGWLLLGDSVDSYRVKDSSGGPSSEFRPQLNSALYLLTGEYPTLVHDSNTCTPEAPPTVTPQQEPTPAPRKTPTPVESAQP